MSASKSSSSPAESSSVIVKPGRKEPEKSDVLTRLWMMFSHGEDTTDNCTLPSFETIVCGCKRRSDPAATIALLVFSTSVTSRQTLKSVSTGRLQRGASQGYSAITRLSSLPILTGVIGPLSNCRSTWWIPVSLFPQRSPRRLCCSQVSSAGTTSKSCATSSSVLQLSSGSLSALSEQLSLVPLSVSLALLSGFPLSCFQEEFSE